MRKIEGMISVVVVVIIFVLMGFPVHAQNGSVRYGGIEFPLGDKSFADKVLNFTPGKDTGEKDGAATIGSPDAGKGTGPSIIGHKGDVSLGKGGSITLKFTDNYLINVKGIDLYIFEAGRDVEPFNVAISKDGSSWINLGTVRGQPTGLDIQGKVAPGDKFSYVRLSDPHPYEPRDPNKIGQTLYWGADIDAVGAIGSEEKHDSDGDEISDDHDKCPDTSTGIEVDENGCPLVNIKQDSDGDGVFDDDDTCPGTSAGTEVDQYGCAVSNPPPSTPSCNWTGSWDTSWGKVELVQKGSVEVGAEVTGTGSLLIPKKWNIQGSSNPVKNHINGIVMDNKLAGNWAKHPSYGPPVDAGDMMFIISEDCSSFQGKWRYGYKSGEWDDHNWDGDWTGSRVDSSKPPTIKSSKQTDCASAKPSFTEGSVFKPARFVIGGTEPQQVTITQHAENFSLTKEDGGLIYQVIKGKSWGSLVLEPGSYILSCNGGGSMGLMSASVCIEFPVVDEVPSSDDQTTPPESKDKKESTEEVNNPSLPQGPIERINIRPKDNLAATKLYMKIKQQKKFIVWGEDAVGNKKKVTVKSWEVRGGNSASISKDGVFKAGSKEGVLRILARIKNQEGDNITGAFTIMVSKFHPITFTGCVKLYDKNKKPFLSGGEKLELTAECYDTREDFKQEYNGMWCVDANAQTNAKGRFRLAVPSNADRRSPFVRWKWTLKDPHTTSPGYRWTHRDIPLNQTDPVFSNEAEYLETIEPDSPKPIVIAPKGFKCFELWQEKMPTSLIIDGTVIHHGKHVKNAKVRLFRKGKLIKETKSNKDGEFQLDVESLPKGKYTLTAQYKPKKSEITTVHNWLYMKKKIFVELPLKTQKKTIDIKMISFAEKVGYPGP